jgi:glycosyltransferase involved in cell wall biosynthesis
MGEYIPTIRKYSKAKIAIRTHNIEHKIWERLVENEKSALKKTYLRIQNGRLKKFERLVLESADAIVPITPVDEKFFRKWGIKKAFCSSPTGLLFEKYKVDHSAEIPFSVFHFGSMDWMPNEEAVLWFAENVWDKVARKVPQAEFYIAGNGISERVRSINKERVKIIGRTETPDYVYHKYQVMLIPLLSGSGMRIKMIEGMGYGKPIVSTTIGAEGIAVQNGNDCFIADSPDEFANCVIELLTDTEKRNALSAQARTFVEQHFDNKKLVAQLLSFYHSLIQ